MATLEHGALITARRHELLEEWVDRLIEAAAYVVGGDLDVKGGSGLPSELVIEIVVARLSRQTRQRAASGRR